MKVPSNGRASENGEKGVSKDELGDNGCASATWGKKHWTLVMSTLRSCQVTYKTVEQRELKILLGFRYAE